MVAALRTLAQVVNGMFAVDEISGAYGWVILLFGLFVAGGAAFFAVVFLLKFLLFLLRWANGDLAIVEARKPSRVYPPRQTVERVPSPQTNELPPDLLRRGACDVCGKPIPSDPNEWEPGRSPVPIGNQLLCYPCWDEYDDRVARAIIDDMKRKGIT